MTDQPETTVARAFFEAAARFYNAAPWTVLADADPLRLDFDGLEDPLYAVVMGAGGATWGLALYLSGDQLIEIYESGRTTSADVIAVVFTPEREAPAEWRALRRRHQLPIAGPAAIPVPIRHSVTGSSGWPDAQELTLLLEGLEATTTFITRHAGELDAGERCAATIPLVGMDDHTVRVSFPAAFRGYRQGAGAASAAEEAETPPGEGGRIGLIEDYRDRALALPGADRLVRRLAWSFFRAPGPSLPDTRSEDEVEHALARFIEWAVFFVPLPPDQRTLAERALEQAASTMTREDSDQHRRFIHPRWSWFEIVRVDRDAGMDVRDLLEGDALRIRERAGTHYLERGQAVIGPVFAVPGSDDWILGAGITAWPSAPELGDTATLRVKPHEIASIFEARMMGAGLDWVGTLESRKLRSAWTDFRTALGETGTKLPAFGRLEDWIRLAKSPLDLPRRLGSLVWWNEAEVEILMAFVARVWNLTPRRELKGRSPDEMVAEEGIGPQEQHLARLMARELAGRLADFGPDTPADDAREHFTRLSSEWFATPREDLGGRTPGDVIAEERAIRGVTPTDRHND